jgi:dihydroorotase
MTDLILRGGRVIDPASGRDETADIAFGDGKVTEIGRDLPASGAEIIDMRGLLVVPGLIDLHTHVYWGGTSLGVEAVEVARQSGTTTFVDAGSAGPGTFHGFRRHVIELSPLRIIPYLNVSFPGIFAVSAAVTVGECADLRLLDPRECVRVIRANRDLIAGVKVRVGRNAGGASGVAPLDIALEVAEETGLPVMAHLDNPPPSRLEVLARLRRGDVLTHCFRPFPNAPVKGSRGTATAHSARSCVSRELVAPAAGMTVAGPIPLRASRRVAVGLRTGPNDARPIAFVALRSRLFGLV